MQTSPLARPAIGALALAAALCLAPASALAKGATVGASPLAGAQAGGGLAPASTSLYTLDVSGIFSVDPEGDPLNEIRELQIGGSSRVVGIGWDVTLFADAPSWLSEMVVSFGASSGFASIYLTPGVGDNFPGTMSYSSGGVVDLVGLGLDFGVGADGKLRMEFFEDFDDFANDWDGIWQSGTLTLQVAAIPEPATYGMMAVGLLGVGALARRRRG